MNVTAIKQAIDIERVIGVYEGQKSGDLFIAIGGIHGNEAAGVLGIERLLAMLENEPNKNPDFYFNGNFVGLKGNLQALKIKDRFIDRDLNRSFLPAEITRIFATPEELLIGEDKELFALINHVNYFIEKYKPEKLIVLDIHTTTAHGGIFSITSPELESEKVALGLHAPVLRGIMEGLKGTTLNYFTKENTGVDTTTVVFESGQHYDPQSVDYAVSALVNCFRAVGCVRPLDVEKRHDNLLKEHSKLLPNLVRLLYTHHIKAEDEFVMQPNYKNFQPVKKGELLAYDRNGAIYSHLDALILMPLYQKQGSDGFFLIKEVKE